MMLSNKIRKQICKLINEYESRIKDCDTLLLGLKEKRRKQRKGEDVNMTWDEIRAERMQEDAKRQAYVQFIANLKDILGEI